jgi:hypothetical protein
VKRILFIAPEFFTFHLQIKQGLEELGHKVYFLPDRPSQNALVKILIRKFRFLITPFLQRFFADKMDEVPADIDEVFIIRGEGIVPATLKRMRQRFHKARFQYYLWDSLKQSPGALLLIDSFDRVWTYDLQDSRKDSRLKFTPNFYLLPKTRAPADTFKYDLTFLGTAHGDRLKVVAKLSANLPKDVRFYRFMYFQAPILYYFRKIFDPHFKYFFDHERSFKPKFGKEWEEVIGQTSAILDIQHPNQGGLTIRTLESLAMGFKLVTTDETVREYPFYDENRIRIIDRRYPRLDPEFLKLPNRFELHPSLKELELTTWLTKIFS